MWSGAAGGLLTPALATGAATGAVVALLGPHVGLSVSVPRLALIMAVGVLAVTQRAPLFAATFGIEPDAPTGAAVAGAGAHRGRRPGARRGGPPQRRRAPRPPLTAAAAAIRSTGQTPATHSPSRARVIATYRLPHAQPVVLLLGAVPVDRLGEPARRDVRHRHLPELQPRRPPNGAHADGIRHGAVVVVQQHHRDAGTVERADGDVHALHRQAEHADVPVPGADLLHHVLHAGHQPPRPVVVGAAAHVQRLGAVPGHRGGAVRGSDGPVEADHRLTGHQARWRT